MRTFRIRYKHTIEVGLGALTGRPLALTGARVPALSAALCSRWIYAFLGKLRVFDLAQCHKEDVHTRAFLEMGMIVMLEVLVQ